MKEPKKNLLRNFILFLCFCASIYLTKKFIDNSSLFFTSDFSLNIVEGLSVYLGKQLLSLKTIYSNPTLSPYTLNLYPPMYPLISAFLFYIFDANINILRTLTLISEILISLIGTKIIFLKSKNRFISSIFAPVILGLFSISKFHGIARVDFIALLFSSFALLNYINLIKEENKKSSQIILYIIFSIFAVFTKQTSGLIFLFCFFHTLFSLFVEKNNSYKRLLISELITILIYLIASLLLTIITDSEYLKQNFLYQLIFNFSQQWRLLQFGIFIKQYYLLIPWLILAIFSFKNNFLLLYILINFLWAFFSLGKIGSDQNYMLELIFYIIVYIGIFFGKLINENIKKEIKATLLLTFLISIIFQVNKSGFFHIEQFSEAHKNDWRQVEKIFKTTNNWILSEDSLYLIQNGKKSITYDPVMIYSSLNTNNFPMNNFVEEIKNSQIDIIITSKLFESTPKIKSIIDENYKLEYKTQTSMIRDNWFVNDHWYIYRKNSN